MKTTFAPNSSTQYPVAFDAQKVGVFASDRGTMVVNKKNHPEDIAINGCAPIRLAAFEVRFLAKMECAAASGNTGGGTGGPAQGGPGGAHPAPHTTARGAASLAATGQPVALIAATATLISLFGIGILAVRILRR